MAINLTLQDVATLQNSSIVAAINANNTLIETGFEDCLSLSGSQPNQMQANLDMNSQQIINLPAPATLNSPIRVIDFQEALTGVSSSVFGLLAGNNSWTGTNTFITQATGTNNTTVATTAFVKSQSGISNPYPVVNAATFSGATADVQITNAIATLPASGGTVDARSLSNFTISATGITITKSNVTVIFPSATFSMLGQIIIQSSGSQIGGVSLIGAPVSTPLSTGTVFNWAGSSLSSGIIVIRGAYNCLIQDITVKATGTPTINGIQQETLSGFSITGTQMMRIQAIGAGSGGLATGMQIGYRWVTGTGGDNNNDVNCLYSCYSTNIGSSAYSIEHSQSKTHSFVNCNFLRCIIGVNCSAGSFKWFGGSGGAATDADFVLGSPNDYILIEGWNTENSNRLLRTGGSSTASPVSIINCRYAANNLNADNLVVNFNYQGGLYVQGLVVDAPNNLAAPTLFSANAAGRSNGSVAIGCKIFWKPGVAGNNPFSGSWSLSKNWLTDNSTQQAFRVADTMSMQVPAPITTTGTTYSQTGFEGTLTVNAAGSCTVTLLSVASFQGVKIRIRTIANQAVVSASSNVVPLAGGSAGTSILAATAGKWADLECDGTSWIITASN